jgi:DNA-binding MarR family transcriptional regulator
MSEETFIHAFGEGMEALMRKSMRRFLRHARESGLSMSHIGAIFHTHRFGSCGVTEIGEHLGVSSAAASQMLERLVQQDLVLRTEDPDDRRVKRIELTDKGRHILEEGLRARQTWLKDLARSLDQDERETVEAAMKILVTKINELE